MARKLIGQYKGQHPTDVFTYENEAVKKINRSTYERASKRAALKRPSIAQSRVHSWQHTFGTRLRNQALYPEEERKDLIRCKSGRSMIEDYSVSELNRMLEYCEKIYQPPERQMVLAKRNKRAV